MFRAQLVWLVFAFGMGTLLPVQTGMNVRLREVVGSPYRASLVSFFVGTVALLVLVLLTRAEPSERSPPASTAPPPLEMPRKCPDTGDGRGTRGRRRMQ
ncbi:DMT family transporter [Archangium violaceum]|uniref:DMT family transporter n=1 Tax=Archangium violaceum TaxID=83451 RepID=UPI00193C2F23|nr:DMT family transporter [Archangium violaceum]QRK07481.1 DMT family transporter [Archangium violaceum]